MCLTGEVFLQGTLKTREITSIFFEYDMDEQKARQYLTEHPD